MEIHPRILAGFVKDSIGVLHRLDPRIEAEVLSTIAPSTRRAIQRASPISFIDVALDVELTEAFFAVAGAERARWVLRANMSETFRKPILRPLVDGAFAIFGREPTKILHWSERAWGLLSRDCGLLELTAASGSEAVLVLGGAPHEIASSRPYLEGMASAVLSFFDVASIPATAEVVMSGSEPPRFEIIWNVGNARESLFRETLVPRVLESSEG